MEYGVPVQYSEHQVPGTDEGEILNLKSDL